MTQDDLPHRPFPKIATNLDVPLGGRWIATEKIHGAHFVVATDGTRVRFGKRKAWLHEDDAFFGWQMLRAELEPQVLALHEALKPAGPIYVYGELFGGGYPHPDVAPLPLLTPVQTGIAYAPDLRWAAFDVLEAREEGADTFVAQDVLEDAASMAGLMLVPVLARGSWQEVRRSPVAFESRVPATLGLPPLAANTAEGYVLKPEAGMPASQRPLVKVKIPEFDELRFGASQAFDPHALPPIEVLATLAVAMTTPLRLASARSKVGVEAVAIIEEAVLDVSIDLEAMLPDRMASLAPEAIARLHQAVADAARSILRTPPG